MPENAFAAMRAHARGIGEAGKAVRVPGRETRDGPEPVHVHIAAGHIDTGEAA